MSANFPSAAAVDYAAPAVRAGGVRGATWWSTVAAWSDRVAFTTTIVTLVVAYGLLQNPYWVPAGDSELYTAAARSIALGKGYEFNGLPIAISPPGWSWMMAAVMKVTPYFLPLKLLAMTCTIGGLAIGYWIARRFVSPAQAAAVILLTAMLSHVYQGTYWLISEGAFCLASSASILLAMQVAEGRKHWSRIALLLFTCAAAVTIRWAGLFGMLIVVAALLDGQWKPRLSATWIASALVVLVTVGTLIGWREGLKGTPEQMAAAADALTGTGEDTGAAPAAEGGAPVSGSANQAAGTYQIFPTGSYADRLMNWGRWFSFLYWQPLRAAAVDPKLLRATTALGWVLIALLGVLVVTATLRKRWIWLATGAYAGILAIGWTNVNARYYVPIAFLITLGIFLATDQLLAWSRQRAWLRRTVMALLIAFVSSVVLCNAATYAVEVRIARSSRFYSRYEAGLNNRLILACQYLNALPDPPKDREIAVSLNYTNMGRSRSSPFGQRATVLLTGRAVEIPRSKDSQATPTGNTNAARRLRAWLRSKRVRYYLYQPPISPWRVWHFRMGWLEKKRTGTTAEKDTAGWLLYHVEGDRVTEVPLPYQRVVELTRVPGL